MSRRVSLTAVLAIMCLLGIVGCAAGTRSTLLPATSEGTAQQRSPQSLPTGSPVVSGTIAGVSSTQILIHAGHGCGYVNVNYTSSTPIVFNGYTLSNGVMMYVWGTGKCSTSFTATYISLGTSSIATPAPTPAPSPAP